MKISGIVKAIYFNTRAPDDKGNYISPVVVIEKGATTAKVYFPKKSEEKLDFKVGDRLELIVEERNGYIWSSEESVEVVGKDRRARKPAKDRDEQIRRGQAFNLAYSNHLSSVEDEIFRKADEIYEMIKRYQGE